MSETTATGELSPFREKVTIDFLTLANHVEAVNGLLYMSGGGWTDHNRVIPANGQTPISHFGIGASVCVPWNETNQPHRLILIVENEDATLRVLAAEAQVNVGRPPQLSPGSEQHAIVGISVDTVFPRAGVYRLVAELSESGERRTWVFRVHDVPAMPTMAPLQG